MNVYGCNHIFEIVNFKLFWSKLDTLYLDTMNRLKKDYFKSLNFVTIVSFFSFKLMFKIPRNSIYISLHLKQHNKLGICSIYLLHSYICYQYLVAIKNVWNQLSIINDQGLKYIVVHSLNFSLATMP